MSVKASFVTKVSGHFSFGCQMNWGKFFVLSTLEILELPVRTVDLYQGMWLLPGQVCFQNCAVSTSNGQGRELLPTTSGQG